MTVQNEGTGLVERIDLPMRGIVGGYHANLIRMYRYLQIPTHVTRFLYAYADARDDDQKSSTLGEDPGTYFIHSSNLHRGVPKPKTLGWMAYFLEVLYLTIWNFWFTFACFTIPPKIPYGGLSESFGEYSRRIRLPQRFVAYYVLPAMSVIATCSHEELLRFPAGDVINYKTRSTGKELSTVCGGVRQVQSKLLLGINDVRTGTRVEEVVSQSNGKVTVRWQSTTVPSSMGEETFDKVVLAVSPDVAAKIFSPLKGTFADMPTRRVQTLITDPTGRSSVLNDDVQKHACAHCSGLEEKNAAQVMILRTRFSKSETQTEALHTMPNGVVVVTCPLDGIGEEQHLQAAQFTRTLRDVRSRAVVQRIMSTNSSEKGGWVNGADNVWIAGSWCWDGMVLLEGCVVSAMRVAQDLGVTIPWA